MRHSWRLSAVIVTSADLAALIGVPAHASIPVSGARPTKPTIVLGTDPSLIEAATR
jgi:hypothetical protein